MSDKKDQERRWEEDIWKIADKVIEIAYPDIYNKGRGWWGGKRIPNFGILHGAIVSAIFQACKVRREEIEKLQQRWHQLKFTLQNDYKQGHYQKAGRALTLIDEYEEEAK